MIDNSSGKALPYAHIYLKNNPQVLSTTNLDGYFEIQAKVGDTLAVSFMGYKSQNIPIERIKENIEVNMSALSFNIPTINIEEESDLLYVLVARSRKSMAYYTESAKTYYFQESSINGKTNEMIEAYYNAKFKGYDLEELSIKNGRIGLQEHENGYFINMQSSKAIMMHKLILKNNFFPGSPFGSGKRKLKKEYQLDYQNSYETEKGNKIYEISFIPRDDGGRFFRGTLWIDSSTANIQKVEMEAENCQIHPFQSIFPDGKLEQLDLKLRKTFVEIDSKSYPREIDFSYQLKFTGSEEESFMISSNTLLYAFDYDKQFYLPKISFPIGLDNDYRKINALPYNSAFWMNKPFQLSDKDGQIESFFRSKSTIRARNAIYQDGSQRKSFFEHPYIIWKGERVRMKDMELEKMPPPLDPKEGCVYQENEIIVDQYNFNVQLFMDLNLISDSLNYLTSAIFDPYKSYYYIKQDEVSTVFMNIYFDLAEIQSRKLHSKLDGIQDVQEAEMIYREMMAEFRTISKDYFSEVQRGTKRDALKDWNDEVRKNLGIDNFKIFRLDEIEN